MSTNKSKIYILMAFSLLFAVGFAVLRIVLMINNYNFEQALYYRNIAGVTVARVVFALCLAALGAASLIIIKKEEYKKLPEASHGVVFTSALCGFMFISSVVLVCYYFAYDIFKNAANAESALTFSPTVSRLPRLSCVVFVIMCVLGLVSALYYFWCASTTTKLNKLNNKLLSFMPSLWAFCYLIYMYFCNDTVQNSEERAIIQAAAICFLLYTLSEARFHFGMARNKAHIAISCITVTTLITACVPNFVLTALGYMPLSVNTVFSALLAVFSAYIIVRLISFASGAQETQE